MLPLFALRASAWMLQATATLPDTIYTRQVVERGWFDQLAHVAGGVLMILLLLLVVLAFPAAWYVRRGFRQVAEALDGLRHDLGPLIERTRGVMQNAEEISVTVRGDVERLSETVERFEAQLREVADITGRRVRQFDALLGAVQEEAEDLFLTTASTARGIRAGVRALRGFRNRRSRRAELEEALDARDGDDAGEDGAAERPRAPRRRRRRRDVS
ncbi:MAG: hypothetical protein KGL38_00745 [Gemmatimonadota bacterium]|nr:hypothetical protein [Gemmatimonadota bacterium]